MTRSCLVLTCAFFATTTLVIAVPTAIKVYNWVLTLWRGNIHLNVPMLFAIAFIFTFVNGGLTGLFLGNVVVDLPLSDTKSSQAAPTDSTSGPPCDAAELVYRKLLGHAHDQQPPVAPRLRRPQLDKLHHPLL